MISAQARVAGVMGWPVGHSLSPRLHGYWLDRYGIDGAYVPLPVRPDSIASAIAALPLLGFAGANVTIPHKEAALAAADETSAAARRIGAVNTLVVRDDGSVLGDNTDGFGFAESLKETAPEWRASTGVATVIGAGGAARAVVATLIDGGAPEVRLVNRTREKAETLATEFDGPCRAVPWSERAAALADTALAVNTTSLGMVGEPPLDLDLDQLPPDAIVADIVYRPLRTALLDEASRRGNRAVDGLGMLLHQARPGFAAWFGVEPEVTPALRRHVLDALEA